MHIRQMSSQCTGDVHLHLAHSETCQYTQATGIDLERILFFDNERGHLRDDARAHA
jgi:hypothetical protein